MKQEDPSALFWEVAKNIRKSKDVTKGTLMGFPCLRVNGDFFATTDHRTGDLIVKLPTERVQSLVENGAGHPFAPAGRVFREWVMITDRDTDNWRELILEAKQYVKGNI